MKIAFGSDHAGFHLKNVLLEHFKEKNIECKDFGTFSSESCDYPDYAQKVAEAVAKKEFDFGILVCGTGIGIGISANKVPGIRAVSCSDTFSAHASREHNDANIIAMGARVVGEGLALDIADIFINTEFSNGERHIKRIQKISQIEKKYCK